jgi:hypothetical protein
MTVVTMTATALFIERLVTRRDEAKAEERRFSFQHQDWPVVHRLAG